MKTLRRTNPSRRYLQINEKLLQLHRVNLGHVRERHALHVDQEHVTGCAAELVQHEHGGHVEGLNLLR